MVHAYMAAFREGAQLYAIQAQPDLNSALRIPGMISAGDEEEFGEAVTRAVLEATAEAVALLNVGREREGAATFVGDTSRAYVGPSGFFFDGQTEPLVNDPDIWPEDIDDPASKIELADPPQLRFTNAFTIEG